MRLKISSLVRFDGRLGFLIPDDDGGGVTLLFLGATGGGFEVKDGDGVDLVNDLEEETELGEEDDSEKE